MKRLLAVLVVLLVADLAAAQPNLSYSCARDKQNIIVTCSGLRPVVTAEMGIPPGTPFFDMSTFLLYYWSGTAWTAGTLGSALTSSGTAVTSTLPFIVPDGTATAPGLGFASTPTSGLYRATASVTGISAGGVAVAAFSSALLNVRSTATIGWVAGAADPHATAPDTTFSREAAATIQMGVDTASAVSQTFKGADSTGNGTAGGILTIRGGAGTAGDAKGGNLNLIGGDNFGTGEEGVVAIVDGGTKPTCSATTRGAFWYDQGGAGVADTFEVCARQAAGDTYAWRSIATIP